MSTKNLEAHREAMAAFYALEAGQHVEESIPCSAGLTAVLFRRLGIDVDEWDVLWVKLYGRPVERVFKFWQVAKDAKPEQLNSLINQFGKKVPPLEGVS